MQTPSPNLPQRLPAALADGVVFFMFEHVGDLLVHSVIDFSEPLDLAQMQRAVRCSLAIEPILNYRFVMRWWRAHWELRDDLDKLDLCDLVETTDLEADVDAYLCHPTDPRVDPLVHVRIFRHAQGDTLCVKLHHITADGGAIKQYTALLASLYTQLAKEPDFSPPISPQKQRDIDPIFAHIKLRHIPALMRQAWRDVTGRFWPPRNLQYPKRDRTPTTQRTYVLRHLTQEEVSKLQRFGRAHQATLNDVLMTAYLRAWYRWVGPVNERVPLRVMATVDLRRYLPTRQAETLCNLSNFFSARLPSHAHATGDFAETLQLVQEQTTAQKRGYIGIGDLYLLRPMLRILPFAWNRKVFAWVAHQLERLLPPSMTNMGELSQQHVHFDGIPVKNAFLTADVIYPPHVLLAASGYNQQLTLSIGYCQTFLERAEIQAFLDDIFSEVL
ncbi:MAG: hypothetical protein H6728_01055 [Myxococcales bacterium]|nr:hypothetical protein [Myxococcales bacterium]